MSRCGSNSSCDSSSSRSGQFFKQPNRPTPSWWVGLVFKWASMLFHSPYARSSESRHNRVMRLFQRCADRGLISACSLYGHILLYRGVTAMNKQQGVHYLRWAADAGDAKACFQIAELMREGAYGLVTDAAKEFCLYLLAAKSGHGLAEQTLMSYYQTDQTLVKRLIETGVLTPEDEQWFVRHSTATLGS